MEYVEARAKELPGRGFYIPIYKEVTVAASTDNVVVFDSDEELSGLLVPGIENPVIRVRAVGYTVPSGIENIRFRFDGQVTLSYGTYQLGGPDTPHFFLDQPFYRACGRFEMLVDNKATVDVTIAVRIDLQVAEE